MSHPVAMMAGMWTTTEPDPGTDRRTDRRTDFVTTSFATCASFAAAADGSPVCEACGWLRAEHDHGIAEVRALPRSARLKPRPKRLAS